MLHLLAQFARQGIDFDALEKFLDRFRAHHGLEAGGTELLVEFAVLGLVFNNFVIFDAGVAGFNRDVGFKVENRLEIAERDIEKMPDAAGQSLEEPDVRAGRGQFDVAQTLAADFRQSDFYTAFVADHSAVLHALVLAAETLPVGDRAKDAGAEQAVALRLESAIVDGFRLGYFPMRPAPDLLGGRQTDSDGVEVSNGVCHVKWARTKHVPPLSCDLTRPPAALDFSSQFPVLSENRFELCLTAALRASAAVANHLELCEPLSRLCVSPLFTENWELRTGNCS